MVALDSLKISVVQSRESTVNAAIYNLVAGISADKILISILASVVVVPGQSVVQTT